MGRISALTELTSLASNDYLIVLDSSANIAKKITVANAFGVPEATWTAAGETWTYSAWNSSTRIGVITVPTDATTKYQAGNRIKITQTTGGTKYGIIHVVATTALHVFFPSGTTLNNETISSPYYTALDSPKGFDKDESLWRIEVLPTSNTGNTPSKNTWYRPSTTGVITYGAGKWNVGYLASVRVAGSGSSWASQTTTLSTTTNSETITESTAYSGGDQSTSGVLTFSNAHSKDDIIRTVAGGSTETLNILHRVDVQGTVISSNGLNVNSRIVATSAYL